MPSLSRFEVQEYARIVKGVQYVHTVSGATVEAVEDGTDVQGYARCRVLTAPVNLITYYTCDVGDECLFFVGLLEVME